MEGQGFRDRTHEYERLNAQILGASLDTVGENAVFATKFSFPFPLLCNTDGAMCIAYGACADAKTKYPARITFVVGPTGLIEQAHGKVDAKNHPQSILESLSGPAKAS